MDQFAPGNTSSEQPASRQKSCNACVRSKRKCDKLAPVCSRCAERDEPCVYKRRRRRLAYPEQAGALYEVPEHDDLLNPLGKQQEGEETCPAVFLAGAKTSTVNQDNSAAAAVSSPTSSFLFAALSPFDFDFMDFSDTIPADGIPPTHTTTQGTRDVPQVAAAVTNPDPVDPSLSFAIGSSSDRSSMWLTTHGQQGLEVERPGTPVNQKIQATYEKMGDLCAPFEPWILYDPTSRSSYLHNRIKAFPSDLATNNATPFLHRHLYKDHWVPPCIMACFSTSVMYTNRTEANKGMVFRALQQDLDKLVETTVDGLPGLGPVTTTPYEKLARVHALFMYQIIRLFDGDVTLRAQGERDIQLLEGWVGDLCRIRDNLGGSYDLDEGLSNRCEVFAGKDLDTLGEEEAGGTRSNTSVKATAMATGCMRDMPPPVSWERWIFAESVRRTILMVYAVMGMYQIMKKAPLGKGGTDDPGPWKYIYRWTLSRSLWEAENSFEFYRAWEEKKPHFIVENFALGEFLQFGRADQVDEFAKIILTAYVGQDATKEFLSGKRLSTVVGSSSNCN